MDRSRQPAPHDRDSGRYDDRPPYQPRGRGRGRGRGQRDDRDRGRGGFSRDHGGNRDWDRGDHHQWDGRRSPPPRPPVQRDRYDGQPRNRSRSRSTSRSSSRYDGDPAPERDSRSVDRRPSTGTSDHYRDLSRPSPTPMSPQLPTATPTTNNHAFNHHYHHVHSPHDTTLPATDAVTYPHHHHVANDVSAVASPTTMIMDSQSNGPTFNLMGGMVHFAQPPSHPQLMPPPVHMPHILGTGLHDNPDQIALMLQSLAAFNTAMPPPPPPPLSTLHGSVVPPGLSLAPPLSPTFAAFNGGVANHHQQQLPTSTWPTFPAVATDPRIKQEPIPFASPTSYVDESAIHSPTPKRPRIKAEPGGPSPKSPLLYSSYTPYSPTGTFDPSSQKYAAESFSPLPPPCHSPTGKRSEPAPPTTPALDHIPPALYPLAYADRDEQIMGILATLETARIEGVATVHLIKGYLCHPAAWIRRSALQALLSLSESLPTCPLDPYLYPWLHPLLDDKDADVRILAALVIRMLADADPHFIVPIAAHLWPSIPRTQLTLADDAFLRTASLVHDPIPLVRQSATLELGRFTHVSPDLVLQTLSKKLATSSKRSGTALKLSAEWMPCAGAFVHAMEDEFEAVRHAALDAIAQLADQHTSAFAHEAVAFLLDMTNDEVASVRTRALQVLIGVAEREGGGVVDLAVRDIDDMSDLFVDPSLAVRRDVYRFLAAVRYVDAVALGRVVVELRKSLDRYAPVAGEDNEHAMIMVCLRGIAERNQVLVAGEAASILKLSNKFLRREARPTDVHHAALVVLAYNAALQKPELMRTIPVFIRRQINLIRHQYPGCIPMPDTSTSIGSPTPPGSTSIMSLGSLSLPPPKAPTAADTKDAIRSMASMLHSALSSAVADATPSSSSTRTLASKQAIVRDECSASLPTLASSLASIHLLLDLSSLLLSSLDPTAAHTSIRQSAAHLAWRYTVSTKHMSGGASASWRAAGSVTPRTPARSPSLRPTSPHDTPMLSAARHRTYSVTGGGAGSVRSAFTAGGGCKSIWPTLWIDVVHGGGNEVNLGEGVVEAVRRAVDVMDLVRGVSKVNWSLGVQFRHVSRTKVGENGLVVVPRGLPLELQLTVSPMSDAGPLSPPLPPAQGEAVPSAAAASTPGAAPGLHMHGWPVVVRVDWPHGAATYLAFRGRPSTTREGEQHALVRVGPRSWSGPSSVGVSVGWLVGGNRAQDVKLEGGEGEIGEGAVEFVAVTNVVQVPVRFL